MLDIITISSDKRLQTTYNGLWGTERQTLQQ